MKVKDVERHRKISLVRRYTGTIPLCTPFGSLATLTFSDSNVLLNKVKINLKSLYVFPRKWDFRIYIRLLKKSQEEAYTFSLF